MSQQAEPWWTRGVLAMLKFLSGLGFFGTVLLYAVPAALFVGVMRLATRDPMFDWPIVMLLATGLPILIGGIDVLISKNDPPH